MEQKKQVAVVVNGQEVMMTEGAVLLQELQEKGTQVPHFCYHPGIGVEGSCRLCLVEIKGMPKLATSCTIHVKEGLEVNTHNEVVDKARKGVLEFFLLNHPLDCPFCDKGGECPLQNYTVDSGQFESRFEFEKQHKAKHEVIGEHIILDKERCVLCDRCVRFGRDIAGKEELSIRSRGSKCEIFIPEGTQLTTGYTGNLADICPVGALTSRDYRFKARPWELKTTDTVCGTCSVGCSSQVWRKEAEVLRMTPRIDPNVNEWWLCDRGRFGMPTQVKNRVLAPISVVRAKEYRVGENFAQDLHEDLQGSPVSIMTHVQMSNEEFALAKQLAESTGGKAYLPVSKSVLSLYRLLQKKQSPSLFNETIESAQRYVVLGESLTSDHPVLALRLRRQVHQFSKSVMSASCAPGDFADVYQEHQELPEHEISKALEQVKKGLSGQATAQWESWNVLHKTEQGFVLWLSDRWARPEFLKQIQEIVSLCMNMPNCLGIEGLFEGSNVVGLMDQASQDLASYEDFVEQLQSGHLAEQKLIWFGDFQHAQTCKDHISKVKALIQVVSSESDKTAQASWVLPFENYLERSGTYTNTFGKVQVLRRATRSFSSEFDVLQWLSFLVGDKQNIQ
ncbi:MAG: (2Fe-2S)-binding protein, partial [Bdellovibrionales bacterium]|nr:(2Fe-2S)-binding protein [Bdellovibrionales bacterium]